MKKTIVLVTILVAAVGFCQGWQYHPFAPNDGPEDIQLLQAAFAATGAAPAGAEIYSWAVVGKGYLSPLQMESVMVVLAETFELRPEEYQVLYRAADCYSYAQVEYPLSDAVYLRLQVQAMAEKSIAYIEIRQTHHRDMALRIRQVSRALEKVKLEGEQINISSCLEGHINARLKNSDKLNLAYTTFQAISATYREGVEANGVAIWSGFSPYFSQQVKARTDTVNFGISLRFDDKNQATVVRVATPVLPGSY